MALSIDAFRAEFKDYKFDLERIRTFAQARNLRIAHSIKDIEDKDVLEKLAADMSLNDSLIEAINDVLKWGIQ